MFDRIITVLERALFPPYCLLGAGTASGLDLADERIDRLRPVAVWPHCGRCAARLGTDGVCGRCLATPPPFERVRAAFWLDETLRQLLHRMKYGAHPDVRITRLLAELAWPCLRHGMTEVQALVPVPLHPARLRQRGFNQADWLARDWGRWAGLPVLRRGIERRRDTPQQARLDRRARRRNVQEAFVVATGAVAGFDRVAIVDDVLTTGSTASALAQSLKTVAPWLTVEVWVVARTPSGTRD